METEFIITVIRFRLCLRKFTISIQDFPLYEEIETLELTLN